MLKKMFKKNKMLDDTIGDTMAICKYCEQEKKLCRAHIIPHVFYKKMCDDAKHPQFSKIKLGENKSKISPIGFYDNNILCSECDNKLGYYDHYACEFWDKIEKIAKVEKIGNIDISTISGENYDYPTLKKFFVSLVYRASISQLKEFGNVCLGKKYENQAKLFLEQKYDDKDFGIIIQKRISEVYQSIDKMLLLFGRFKIEGINCYDLFLAGYRIIIKVDKRNFSKQLEPLLLTPSSLVMLHQKLEESKDNDFFKALVKEQLQKNKNFES